MTELLKETLHERADALTPPAPDLDAILGQGRRGVRRRRALTGGLLGTALVAAAVLVPGQVTGWWRPSDDAHVAASEESALSWAQGSVIHLGGRSIDVGHDVYAYVETGSGYVFADKSGTVYAAQGEGTTPIGQIDDASGTRDLVTDGDSAAWLDVTDGRWSFVVHSERREPLRVPVQLPAQVVRGGDELSNAQWQVRNRTRPMALDEQTLYAADQRGLLAIDRTDGTVRVLSTDPELTIYDVQDGHFLVRSDDAEGATQGTYATTDLASLGEALAVDGGDLSPGGRYVMSENSKADGDDFTLVALADGTSFAPEEKAAYDFFTGYRWLDDERYLAFGMQQSGRSWAAEAMTCSVARRSCDQPIALPGSKAGDGGDFDSAFGFQLPIGEHIG